MKRNMIRYLVYGVTLCVLQLILSFLDNRSNIVNTGGQNDLQYIVKAPAALKNVYIVMFGLGMLLFAAFFILKVKGNPTVTVGHLWFALIFAAIGLLVMVLAGRWKLTVQGDRLTAYRLFHRSVSARVSELDRTVKDSKGNLILYQDGKVLVKVDVLSDNYDRLVRTLSENGKL